MAFVVKSSITHTQTIRIITAILLFQLTVHLYNAPYGVIRSCQHELHFQYTRPSHGRTTAATEPTE